MLQPPCRVLIGPLFNPALIGRYAQHAQVRTFMPQSVFTEKYRYDYVYNPYTIRHFNQIFEEFSDDWRPDLVIWWDPVYQAMPPGIEDCPYPTALIPGDWNLAFLTVLQAARSVDGVFADGRLGPILRQAGIANVHPWIGFAHDPVQIWREPALERLHDVCFIGNMNPHIHPERSRYLAQLLNLQERYRLFLRHGVWGDEYRRALNQSRIVFNYTICQVLNMRAFEAPACGALLFIESANQEVRQVFRDGESCVLYDQDNLLERLDYYLRHEEERAQIAEAGYRIALDYTWERHFERLLQQIPALLEQTPSMRPVFRQTPALRRIRALNQLSSSNADGAQQAAVHLEALRHSLITSGLDRPRVSELNALFALLFPYLDEEQGLKSAYSVSLAELGQWLDNALGLLPEHPVLHYHRGLVAEYQQEDQLALWSFSRSIELMAQGHHEEVADWREFIVPFNKSGRGSSQLVFAWEYLSYRLWEQPDTSPLSYVQLLGASIWQRIGRILMRQGRDEKALIAFENASLNYPQPGLQIQCAQIYSRLDQAERLIPLFEKMMGEQPLLIQQLIPLLTPELLLAHTEQISQWTAFFEPLFPELKQVQFLTELIQVARGQRSAPDWQVRLRSFPITAHFYHWFCSFLQRFEQVEALKGLQKLRQPLQIYLDLPLELPPTSSLAIGFIGGEAHAENVWRLRRPWQAALSKQEWILSPTSFPFAFPAAVQSRQLEQLEGIQHYWLGILTEKKALRLWLQHFQSVLLTAPHHALVLWSPTGTVSLADLEAIGGLESDLPLAWLDEPLSLEAQSQLLMGAEGILGHPQADGLYYGCWAWSLGKPVFWPEAPLAWPYPEHATPDVKPWPEVFAQWPQQENLQRDYAAGFVRFLSTFEKNVAKHWLQGFWEQRLQIQLPASS
ncbi:MAG: glycosyltransferase family protein [Candidatus Sericytochromatia bacterium]